MVLPFLTNLDEYLILAKHADAHTYRSEKQQYTLWIRYWGLLDLRLNALEI